MNVKIAATLALVLLFATSAIASEVELSEITRPVDAMASAPLNLEDQEEAATQEEEGREVIRHEG